MDLTRYLNLKETSVTGVLRDEFSVNNKKEFNPQLNLINPFTVDPDTEFYSFNNIFAVSPTPEKDDQLLELSPDLGIDLSQLDVANEDSGFSVIEVFEAEKSICEDSNDSQNLLDISQNYFDFSYEADISSFSAGSKNHEAPDYPFFGDSSSDSDFDFEEGDDFVSLRFTKSAKKSRIFFAKKRLNFSGYDTDSPRPVKEPIRDINGPTTVIKLTAEKLSSATQYFDIDIADIKKYYTNKGECLLCGNIYFSSATARRHIKLSHMKLRDYKCPQCFLTFQEHKGVKEHLRRFHPEYQIVDLRTVKKEFRKSIVGGILQDRIDPDIFEDKKDVKVVEHGTSEKVSKKKKKFRPKEIVLLECEHCDEKFRNVTSVRVHISKVHKNPEISTPETSARSTKRRRRRHRSTSSHSKEAKMSNSVVQGKPETGIKIKKEPVDSSSFEELTIKKEKKIQKLDAQRNLIQTLISELNEDDKYSQILSGNGGARKIKQEPLCSEESFEEANTDGLITLQTVTLPSVDDNDLFSHSEKIQSAAEISYLMDCPKCKTRLEQIAEFNSHMLEHWKVDKSCAVCGKTKSNKHTLLVHVRIHSGEKPFKCRKCGSDFTQVANVKHHEKRCKVSNPETSTTDQKPPKGTKSKKSKSSGKKGNKKTSKVESTTANKSSKSKVKDKKSKSRKGANGKSRGRPPKSK